MEIDNRMIIRRTPWLIWIFGLGCVAGGIAALVRGASLWGGLVAIGIGLALLLLLAERVTCLIDRQERIVVLVRRRLFRKRTIQFSFDELASIVLDTSHDYEGSDTYRAVFILRSGERVPLTSYLSGSRRANARLVERMTAFINEESVAPEPVKAALDGVARTEREGVTDGVRWTAELAADSSSTALTRLFTAETTLPGWSFLLMVPAAGGMQLPTSGLLGNLAKAAYRRFMAMAGLSEEELPGLEQATVLPVSDKRLSAGATFLTSNPPAAEAWLTARRAALLGDALAGSASASRPLILLVNARGLWLIVRGGEPTGGDPLDALARLAAALVAP